MVQPAPYWLGRCHYNVTGWDRSHGLPALSHVWQHVKLSDSSVLGPVRDITLLLTRMLRNQPNKEISLVSGIIKKKKLLLKLNLSLKVEAVSESEKKIIHRYLFWWKVIYMWRKTYSFHCLKILILTFFVFLPQGHSLRTILRGSYPSETTHWASN